MVDEIVQIFTPTYYIGGKYDNNMIDKIEKKHIEFLSRIQEH